MARSLRFVAAAVLIHITNSEPGPPRPSVHRSPRLMPAVEVDAAGRVREFRSARSFPAVEVDARGRVHNLPAQKPPEKKTAEDRLASLQDVIRVAKENLVQASKSITSKVIGTQVRQHPFRGEGDGMKLRRQRLEEAIGLLEAGEVKCTDSVERMRHRTGKLCHIFVGSNDQVASKLERAVKGLSSRPMSANDTLGEFQEDHDLSNLKAALLEMLFCVRRTDGSCDPKTSLDPKVKAAREQAFSALHALHSKAQVAGGENSILLERNPDFSLKPLDVEDPPPRDPAPAPAPSHKYTLKEVDPQAPAPAPEEDVYEPDEEVDMGAEHPVPAPHHHPKFHKLGAQPSKDPVPASAPGDPEEEEDGDEEESLGFSLRPVPAPAHGAKMSHTSVVRREHGISDEAEAVHCKNDDKWVATFQDDDGAFRKKHHGTEPDLKEKNCEWVMRDKLGPRCNTAKGCSSFKEGECQTKERPTAAEKCPLACNPKCQPHHEKASTSHDDEYEDEVEQEHQHVQHGSHNHENDHGNGHYSMHNHEKDHEHDQHSTHNHEKSHEYDHHGAHNHETVHEHDHHGTHIHEKDHEHDFHGTHNHEKDHEHDHHSAHNHEHHGSHVTEKELEAAHVESQRNVEKQEAAVKAVMSLKHILEANRKDVAQKILDAIDEIDGTINAVHGEKDAVEAEDDHLKKMQQCMLRLHECARMHDCIDKDVVANDACCHPANPTQEEFIEDRDCIYAAWRTVHNDDEEVTKANEVVEDKLKEMEGVKLGASHSDSDEEEETPKGHSAPEKAEKAAAPATETAVPAAETAVPAAETAAAETAATDAAPAAPAAETAATDTADSAAPQQRLGSEADSAAPQPVGEPTTTTLWPPGHPLNPHTNASNATANGNNTSDTSTSSAENEKEKTTAAPAAAPVVVQASGLDNSGSLLPVSLGICGVLVLIAVIFLMVKAEQMRRKQEAEKYTYEGEIGEEYYTEEYEEYPHAAQY